ncbi:NTP/NDP exchange transporter [Segetibacter koreensis]|uniref:NTP/NDP exchange transporter n=1 Tax=Segetibacter koreensis TaxID=398037 RepID=UPI000368030C|nr:MFS transporter [Segetibacter koreensis]
MYYKLLQLLNIKPHESVVVRKLFTIQFFLGVATAFLFTSSLAMFLSAYDIKTLPVAYILSACLLLIFNRIYSYLDEKLSSPTLLGIVILFSGFSILLFWILLTVLPFQQLPLIIASWYMLIYMLVGYAFWGMASILFNVRESKRLFSIVGAGDIPAKMLGYFSVTALVPFIGVNNLLWVSIGSFFVAWYLLNKFKNSSFLTDDDPNASSHINEHLHDKVASGFLSKLFNNRLVLFIALLSLISYIVFSFIDFTFLSDIKIKFHHDTEMATFIAVFFAIGRLLAISIKLLFSSRMISRMGLTNALLVTPFLLLSIAVFIIISGDHFFSHLYVFGFMVLLTEILRSTLQEPVFFILFQPLKPHDRLRGHLVAKGHTMPFALLGVGVFLVIYLQKNNELPILFVAELLVVFLLLWTLTIFIIKKEYLNTLVASLKKGYFTGAELFLDDSVVTNILLKKTESKKPLEVIHSLNLLERSGYTDVYKLLIKNLQSEANEVKEYILTRIIANNMTSALPLLKQQLTGNTDETIKPQLVKTYYYLNNETDIDEQILSIDSLEVSQQRAAIVGLLKRNDDQSEQLVIERLRQWAVGSTEEKLLTLSIVMECPCENYTDLLRTLLEGDNPVVYKKAIEAAGKTKNTELLPDVVELAINKHAYPSLRRSILYYGDIFFQKQNWESKNFSGELLLSIIKTAGNIKGDSSTDFLIDALITKKLYCNEIIEALWLKKSVLKPGAFAVLEDKIAERTEQSRCKVNYYHELLNNKNMLLLQEAILMEIRRDLQVVLKACALLYDREKIDRVIRLMELGNTTKISNSIEVLELIIPKKHFTQLNYIVELMDDVKHKDLITTKTDNSRVNVIIAEILKGNKVNFSEWTRSVACYMLPKLRKNELLVNVLNENISKENHLFNETRNYVLTMLK